MIEKQMESNGVQKRFFSENDNGKNKSLDYRNKHTKTLKQMIVSMMEEGAIEGNHNNKIRFIKKSGKCNVSHVNLPNKSRRFLSDIFTTGVDLQWRWNLFVFSFTFVLSWLVFGLLYLAESYRHGDFEVRPENASFRSCINQLDVGYPFASTFLFSLETQTTIGYGSRHVTEECGLTIFLVVLQSVFGCILDAFMIGLIMAKISRPKKRAQTLLFSENAVINTRDGRLCLMVRVGNLRKSHLVEATIRMQYVHSRQTMEGEFIPVEQIDLNLDLKNDSDRLFLVTPQTICHPIDQDSPLWDLHPKDLEDARFEIIVILEGMVEATGMTTQARASYLPHEILWGHRFQNMISLSRSNAYKVNFKKFDHTYRSNDMKDKSAKEMHETDDSVALRSRRFGSGSSSNRSSIISHHECSASEERDSGYQQIEVMPRSEGLVNRQIMSITSLSDDCEHLKLVEQKIDEEAASTSSSLIDLSTPKPPPNQFTSGSFQVDDRMNAIPDGDLMLEEDAITAPDDDVNLLILESTDTEPNSAPEQPIRNDFTVLAVETSASVCS